MSKDQTRRELCLFLAGTTALTWACIVWMARLDGPSHPALFTALDFLENASPLLLACFLLRKELFRNGGRFLLGTPRGRFAYPLAAALFLAQYWNFRLFCGGIPVRAFFGAWLAQLLLGGGLEEAGWRGYLFPLLRRKFPAPAASALVSAVWVCWHLPYFFQPDGTQSMGFAAYLTIGILTGFCLAAIYLLTESALLCMAFHALQNALAVTCGAVTENPLFSALFLALGVFAAVLCAVLDRKRA